MVTKIAFPAVLTAAAALFLGFNGLSTIPSQYLPAKIPISVTLSWAPVAQYAFRRAAKADEGDFVLADDIKILSYDPFIAHISNFVSPSEREHLKRLSTPLLSPSEVRHANGTLSLSTDRTSSTAFLPSNDTVVQAIQDRAMYFQGWTPGATVDVQITSYQPGQRYSPHWDWFYDVDKPDNRLSTFFAIIEADCDNCGTQFPKIKVDWAGKDQRWCEVVDCKETVLTTKNVPGSAVFWRNLDSQGRGREDTLHAGLPAEGGSKVGLNVWTNVQMDQFKGVTEGDVKYLDP